jgi:hypothetical protein
MIYKFEIFVIIKLDNLIIGILYHLFKQVLHSPSKRPPAKNIFVHFLQVKLSKFF